MAVSTSWGSFERGIGAHLKGIWVDTRADPYKSYMAVSTNCRVLPRGSRAALKRLGVDRRQV